MKACSAPALCTKVFAQVPFPGHALGLVEDGDVLYVGTHHDINGGPGVPPHLYTYDRRGRIVADHVIEGTAETGQGIAGLALDHDGVVYAVDQAPSRIVAVDPRTGEQWTYAELPDVPLCSDTQNNGASPAPAGCSAAQTDRPASPINLAFDVRGNLYVGDLTQALIWRVPPGGGRAEVWYTAADLDSLFGANTIRFLDSHTMLVGDSAHNLQDPANLMDAKGRLFTLEIGRDGKPGKRRPFWEGTRAGDVPDGFAIGRSGRVYVALAIGNQVLVLGPDGKEIARVTGGAEIPFDLPGGVGFFGDQLIVTNQVFLGGDDADEHQVLFAIDVHEQGLEPFRPRIPRPSPSLIPKQRTRSGR